MSEEKLQTVTSDERLKVGLSYLFGWIPALVFWIQSRNDSAYIRFHAMQAILYSVAVACLSVVSYVLMIAISTISTVFLSIGIGILPLLESDSGFIVFLLLILPILGSVVLPFLIFVPLWVVGIINLIAVIQGFSGKDWGYPLLAKWAEKINQRDLETSRRIVQ